MKKEIKYYLHLYLGATIFHPNGQSGELIGVCGDDAHFIHDQTGSYGFCGIDSPLFGKISLRQLSDMTEDEAHDLGVWGTWSDEKKGLFNWHEEVWHPQTFLKLLKQGFDLFGLIESGLAIDKTKIK